MNNTRIRELNEKAMYIILVNLYLPGNKEIKPVFS